ncbi:hypothetical protein ACGIF2_10600 [Cellulomonas sp. P22]|uniref:hypothetical protein n=1 Tax=Cellulomonas sp. P22 TaxID=3373189 RepID=UPI0037A65D99
MSTLTDDVAAAARLVEWGMRPRQVPARDLEYADLVRRHGEDDTFADLVKAVAAGLNLLVLAVDPRSGIVLAPREDSVFAVRIEEYAKRTALSSRGTDKVVHGLAHLAVAALAFPRPDDLANDAYVGYVTVDQVDGVVRDACRVLDERAAQAEENHDPLETAPELERAWRAYARRPATAGTKDGRAASDTTRGMVAKAVRFLAEQGFLVTRSDENGGAYRTTPRFQVQVRELAANAAFRELIDLGVVTVSSPGGTLHAVHSDTL